MQQLILYEECIPLLLSKVSIGKICWWKCRKSGRQFAHKFWWEHVPLTLHGLHIMLHGC